MKFQVFCQKNKTRCAKSPEFVIPSLPLDWSEATALGHEAKPTGYAIFWMV